MVRGHPGPTRTYTLFPYRTRFRSDERDVQDAGRFEALPEDALARTRVADGGEADLVAVAREAARRVTEDWGLAVELRGPREPHGPRPDRKSTRLNSSH